MASLMPGGPGSMPPRCEDPHTIGLTSPVTVWADAERGGIKRGTRYKHAGIRDSLYRVSPVPRSVFQFSKLKWEEKGVIPLTR